MGDAMVRGWGDPAYVRPSSTKLGGGLKPGTLTFFNSLVANNLGCIQCERVLHYKSSSFI